MRATTDRPTSRPFATRSEVLGRQGMVATSQPLATQVGLDVLKRGGNAIDAAIAANAATGLMEPTGNGIGGDLYALVWCAAERKVHALNASGRSPVALSMDELKRRLDADGQSSIDWRSPLAVSVPGAVDGWFCLHQRFGALPMREILSQPIEYAEAGFPVSEATASAWQQSVPRLIDQPGDFRKVFTCNGRAPAKGDVMRNPDLARSYRQLADGGRDAFYKGDIARSVDAFMRSIGGCLRYADFAAHQSEWVEPVATDYRGYTVHQIAANTQGLAVLQMLNILQHYDLAAMGFMSEAALHVMIEAKKLVFEDRAKHYADPQFYRIPVARLLSAEYTALRRQRIGESAAQRVSSGVGALRHGGTVYLTSADRHGNMVSLIQSNFRGMGTGLVAPKTGFSLQNRGELFSLDPLHPNAYAPAKRPFHTIIPGLVTRGAAAWFSFGVMGGEFQPLGQVIILTNIIDFGMNSQEAGDAPRWLHSGSSEPTGSCASLLTDGGRVCFEEPVAAGVVDGLRARGHVVEIGGGFYGRYQGIMRDPDTGVYFGASESRVDGHAAAY